MTTDTPVLLQVACPTCAAAIGPLEGDVVYLDAQKYRVVPGSEEPGLIRLRIRREVVRNVRREQLRYDVVAGMWRRK